MAAPGRPTLKRALDSATSGHQEDRLHKLVGHPDCCTTCAPPMKAEFVKGAKADWNTMAKLRGGKGRQRG